MTDTPAVALYVPMPLNADGDGPADLSETVRVEHQVWDAETCGTLCTCADEAVARHIVKLWNRRAAPAPDPTSLQKMQRTPDDLAMREAVARALYESGCLNSPPTYPWETMLDNDRDDHRERADRFMALLSSVRNGG